MKTRFAMISTGLMAELSARDFSLTQSAELKVIVSRDADRAGATAAKYGIAESSGNYLQVLKRDDIDAIYVASPHVFHFAQSKAALEAGKHVLVEKPIAMNADEARRLKDIAQAHGLFLMEAMWTAFNPSVRRALQLCQEGAIGEPNFVVTQFGDTFTFDPHHRLWNKELGGGTTLDQGIYPISIAHMFLGAPDSVGAQGTISSTGVDDEVIATLTYSHGHAVTMSSMKSRLANNASISGPEGRIDLHAPIYGTPGFTLTTSAGPISFTHEPQGNGYVPMLEAVGGAIQAGATAHPWRTLEESIAVMSTLDAVRRDLGLLT